jgi:hypothetical protein
MSVPFSRVEQTSWAVGPIKMGLRDISETSVSNYKYKLLTFQKGEGLIYTAVEA